MKKVIWMLLIMVVTACSLNGEQEKELNRSLAAYLFARNECQLISYVAFTYPPLVEFFKTRGDNAFKDKFDCTGDSVFLQDPTIRAIEKDENMIQANIVLTAIDENTQLEKEIKHDLVAISSDRGKSWFFLDKSDFVDKTLLPKLKRLLKD